MSNLTTQNNLWLHRFAWLVVGATFILIFIGGLVTSTESGLAVPDWPTTYGRFMFSFPLSQMVGGIFYEHGHRMIASIVGMLTVILALWLWWKEPRKWVRNLGWLALLAVIVQGLLGGLTVIFLLPLPVSVAHGALAQTFFCITIALALFTSPQWKQPRTKLDDEHKPSLRALTTTTTALVFAQLLLGAIMRHTKSGLAIPDFPLAFDKIIPPFENFHVTIHFAHRLGALIVSCFIIWTVSRIFRYYRSEQLLRGPAVLLSCAIVAQLTLGAFTIWSQKAVYLTTAHVATGALILGTSLALALRTRKILNAATAKQIETIGRMENLLTRH